jgi:phosphoribosylformylglycinamidine cyclo-ligase
MESHYSQRGVSSGKEDVHFAIKQLDKGLYPRAFCKVLPDIVGNDIDYCNLMHADGAGTKSALAYLYWKETGDLSVWESLVQDAIVMNIDDLLCVGATGNFMVSNTIGRNKFLIPREVLSTILNGMESFFHSLREMGIQIFNTGGETADVGDVVKTLILDSTVFCRMKRNEVITNEKIGEGTVIIGLASAGQATYEKEYNSGIGSNGLTNARHEVLQPSYKSLFPETFDAQIPAELAYCGKHLLTDTVMDAPLNVGKMLLSPTRTYLPVVQEILAQHRNNIHGMIHCTGGGQTKCLKFVENLRIEKNNLFDIPPVFRLIQSANSGISLREMYQTLNMGHRLEIYTDAATAEAVISISEKYNIPAKIIGSCHAHEGNLLRIHSAEGILEYTEH